MAYHHIALRTHRIAVHQVKPKAQAKAHHAAIHGQPAPKGAAAKKHVKVHKTRKIKHISHPHH